MNAVNVTNISNYAEDISGCTHPAEGLTSVQYSTSVREWHLTLSIMQEQLSMSLESY